MTKWKSRSGLLDRPCTVLTSGAIVMPVDFTQSPIRRTLFPKRYLNTGRHAVIPACVSWLLFKTIYLTNNKKVLVCCPVIQSRLIATGPVRCSASLRQSFRLPSQHNGPLSVPHFARESLSEVHTIMSLVEIAVGFKRQRVSRD